MDLWPSAKPLPALMWALSGLLAAAGLAVGGCGKAGHTAKSTPVVGVSESDFHIAAPTQVKAGNVVLRVSNHGPDRHELIVVRIDGRPLPLRSDGLTVDEEAVEKREAGALEPGAPGGQRELALNLAPGRYVFICNMEGHYMSGMHRELVVTQ